MSRSLSRSNIATILLSLTSLTACGAQQRAISTESTGPLTDSSPVASTRPRTALVPVTPPIPTDSSNVSTGSEPVTLQTLPPETQAPTLVRDFFRAIIMDDSRQLERLLLRDATIKSFDKKQTTRVIVRWRNRFQSESLRPLGPAIPIEESSLTYYHPTDLPDSTPNLGRLDPSDLIVHARVTQTKIGKRRVLPDHVWFVLKPTSRSYLISRVVETLEH